MSGFVYFLPGRKGIDTNDLKGLGLDAVIERPHGTGALSNTPNGGAGFTVGDKATPLDLVRIRPGLQTWKAAPLVDGKIPYWVGINDDARPLPATLERAQTIAGEFVVDLDGRRWLAPQLREWRLGDGDFPFECQARLPRVCDLNDEGDVTLGDVIPRYRDIWLRSWDVASALWPTHVETASVMSDSDAIKFSGELLGVNYRVSFLELALLKSVSIDFARQVCRIGIDAEGFEAAAGNLVSRSASETTVSDCGPDRPIMDEPTNTHIGLQSAS